jgi:hypothetical protein
MKTPMMDVSGTSTFEHCRLTTSAIWRRPWTHCALQRTFGEKSLAWHPAIVDVYACEHDDGRFSMRGVKLASEMAWVAEATPATAAMDMMAANDGLCIVGRLVVYLGQTVRGRWVREGNCRGRWRTIA